MFISDTHLPTLLDPWHYTSPRQLEFELSELFRPGLALRTTADLPRDGDFITCDLLGHPLLVRRASGEIRAYLNVCAHRHCKLTSAAGGHAAEIRCQYHGWEYGDSGETRKIPDAQSFKPLEKGGLGLVTYRTETVGQLVFVSLAADAPCLREYLGLHYDRLVEWYGDEWSQQFASERIVECNWKVLVENSLESYHIEMIHPQTFGKYPPAEACRHELDNRWTAFTSHSPIGWQDALLHKLAGVEPDHLYRHTHLHPNFAYARAGLYATLECVFPLTPTSCRVVARGFLRAGQPGTWRAKLLERLLVGPAKKFLERVNQEDAAIVPEVQAGLNSRQHPGPGLISKREERIFHFQRYVRRAADSQLPPPSAAGAPSATSSGASTGAPLYGAPYSPANHLHFY